MQQAGLKLRHLPAPKVQPWVKAAHKIRSTEDAASYQIYYLKISVLLLLKGIGRIHFYLINDINIIGWKAVEVKFEIDFFRRKVNK